MTNANTNPSTKAAYEAPELVDLGTLADAEGNRIGLVADGKSGKFKSH